MSSAQMHRSIDSLRVVALFLHITNCLQAQAVAGFNSSLTSLLEDGVGGFVTLSSSVDLNASASSIQNSWTVNGTDGVWVSLPSAAGVVRLENGSKLELANMGIDLDARVQPDNLSILSLLQFSFFDVQPMSLLQLHNIVMNIECGTFSKLQEDVCDIMPDFNYEVSAWTIRVLNLSAPGLDARNVLLRCGEAASRNTSTITLPPNINSAYTGPVTVLPCTASLVTGAVTLLRGLYAEVGTDPTALYVLVVANVSGDNTFMRTGMYTPRNRTVIAGRAGVTTQLDLRYLTSIMVWPEKDSDTSYLTLQNIALTNLAYGPQTQYPAALITAGIWFFDFQRLELIYQALNPRVRATNVTFTVSESELRWWRGMVTQALSSNTSSIDPSWLIQSYAPGLRVDADGGAVRVPYWEWANGLMVWENCTITATQLAPTVPLNSLYRMDLLDTLSAYGQEGPVSMSAIRLSPPQMDPSFFTWGSQVILRTDTALQSQSFLQSARIALGANLTIWGDGKTAALRPFSLQAVSGAITVPPYTVLRLRFLTLFNLGVGGRAAEPSPLQNFTMMMWAFNRTLLPAAAQAPDAGGSGSGPPQLTFDGSSRRSVQQQQELVKDGSAELSDHSLTSARRLQQRHHHRLNDQLRDTDGPLPVANGGASEPKRDAHSAEWGFASAAGEVLRRRRLAQSNAADGGGSSSSSGANNGSKIAEGPYRAWLQLYNVNLCVPDLEVQLLYELIATNGTTTLRVPLEVLDFFRKVLATAKVTECRNEFVTFAYIQWLGIEGTNIRLERRVPDTTIPLIPQTASILLPESPPPPRAATLVPPPPEQRPPPPPIASPPPPAALSPPGPVATPPTAAVVIAAAAPAPQSSSVIGPAVGSAAGLIVLSALAAVCVVFVRRRRRRMHGTDKEKGAGGQGDLEGQAFAPRSSSQGRDTPDNGSGRPAHATRVKSGATAAAAAAAAAASNGAAGDEAAGEILAAEDSVAAAAAAAAATPAAGGPLASRQPGHPPRHPSSGSGDRQLASGSGGSGDKASGPGRSGLRRAAGAAAGVYGNQTRKSRSSGASGSAGKSGAGSSGSRSSGAPSDVASNPRTELYAALAAFQSELGEQQQQISITCQLGAGAHGVVYKGEWRGLEVAVKTLLFQAFVGSIFEENGNSLKEQAMLEAAIATTLFHPNVINTFSYDIKPLRMCGTSAHSVTSSRGDTIVSSEGGGIMDWKLYIIQEFCDGGTLKDALDGARFTDPETGLAHVEIAVRVAIEIASGMSYIHARNIIHGDLKPANILLRSNSTSPYGYTAKIADFGLALKLKAGESHISNIRRGTPFYIAAELVEDGRATTASDLYSFGVILWELLHGSTVARRLPLRRRIPNLPAEFYTWPPDCPPAYRDMAAACLNSNPAARPRFIDALGILNKLLTWVIEAKRQQQCQRLEERQRRAAASAEAKAGAAANGQEYGGGGSDGDDTQSLWTPQMLLGGALLGGIPGMMSVVNGNRGNGNRNRGGDAGGKGSGQGNDGAAAQTPPRSPSAAAATGGGGGGSKSSGGQQATVPGGDIRPDNGGGAGSGCATPKRPSGVPSVLGRGDSGTGAHGAGARSPPPGSGAPAVPEAADAGAGSGEANGHAAAGGGGDSPLALRGLSSAPPPTAAEVAMAAAGEMQGDGRPAWMSQTPTTSTTSQQQGQGLGAAAGTPHMHTADPASPWGKRMVDGGAAADAAVAYPPYAAAAAAGPAVRQHQAIPTAAVAAAALAALAASANNTLQSMGVLDSCFGSTDARTMDQGFMMDLRPPLSNQVQSSLICSALSPDLAAALESALGAHGLSKDAAGGMDGAGGIMGGQGQGHILSYHMTSGGRGEMGNGDPGVSVGTGP